MADAVQVAWQMRVAKMLLVSAFRPEEPWLPARSPVFLHRRHLAQHVALFFVEKGLAISDQKLHVANLRMVDCRVIAFG